MCVYVVCNVYMCYCVWEWWLFRSAFGWFSYVDFPRGWVMITIKIKSDLYGIILYMRCFIRRRTSRVSAYLSTLIWCKGKSIYFWLINIIKRKRQWVASCTNHIMCVMCVFIFICVYSIYTSTTHSNSFDLLPKFSVKRAKIDERVQLVGGCSTLR